MDEIMDPKRCMHGVWKADHCFQCAEMADELFPLEIPEEVLAKADVIVTAHHAGTLNTLSSIHEDRFVFAQVLLELNEKFKKRRGK